MTCLTSWKQTNNDDTIQYDITYFKNSFISKISIILVQCFLLDAQNIFFSMFKRSGSHFRFETIKLLKTISQAKIGEYVFL